MLGMGFVTVLTRSDEGTPLPDTLQILHEHLDHYSLQCTKPMTLDGAYIHSTDSPRNAF